MRLRGIGRWAVVLASAGLLSACHADVQAFRASISNDGQDHELVLRDETRSPQEEEAVVSGAADEVPRFRIREISGAVPTRPLQSLELELTGDYRGGGIEITGPAAYTGSFSDAVEFSESPEDPKIPGGPGSILRLDLNGAAVPVTAERLLDAELVFSALEGRSFAIESVRFVTEPTVPRVTFPHSAETPVFDQRAPVIVGSGAWQFPDLSGMLQQTHDGVLLRYHIPEERFRDREERPAISLELRGAGGERRLLRAYLRPGTRDVIVRPALWDIDAQALEVAGVSDGFQLREVFGISIPDDPAVPIPVGMAELLQYPADQWRRDDFELFSWTSYPEVLWFDTRDYEVQARFFRRLAFFVEKRGFIGSLLTDEALQARHGWNAHNYRPEGLAAFFNAARSTGFSLNESELQLRAIVLDRGIIVRDDDGRFLPGRGGVLSVSQASPLEQRRLLIAHEAIHGVFYEELSLRRAAFDYWDNVLEPRERGFWRDFLSWMSYSPEDRYLVVNEFQGYLLQQSERSVRWYFRSLTMDRLKSAYPQRVEQFDIFLRDYPSTFVDAAAAMNQALFEAAGMVGGDPYDLHLPSEE